MSESPTTFERITFTYFTVSCTRGNISLELHIYDSRTNRYKWVTNSTWVGHQLHMSEPYSPTSQYPCTRSNLHVHESHTCRYKGVANFNGWVTISIRVLPLVRSDISTTQYPALAEMWVTNSTCMSHKRVEINQLHMSGLRTRHEPYYSILVTFFKPSFTHDFSVICLSFHTHTCTHAHACVHTHAHTRRCLMKGGNKRPKTCLPLLNVLAGSKLYQETD